MESAQLTIPVCKNRIFPVVQSQIAVVLFFRHVWAYLMRWILTSISALIIYCCVCLARDVRESARYLIIQSDGAAQLCLQPQPCTRDNCEQGTIALNVWPWTGKRKNNQRYSLYLPFYQ